MIPWLILAAAAAGLTWLYLPALTTGFLNDDFLFLEDARQRGWRESLTTLGPLVNYFRPVSRALYFEFLLPVFGLNPLGFHLVNFGLFLVALGLLADLLRVFLPRAGVLAALLYFAVLPFQGVNLRWVSCAQDLLALVFVLATVAVFRRGHSAMAAVFYLLAVFSKESALPLPLLLFAWPVLNAASTRVPAGRLRHLLPSGLASLVWIAVTVCVRTRAVASARLDLEPLGFVAAYAHQFQSLLGLDHPEGMIESLRRHGPAPLALLALAPVALLLTRRPPPLPDPDAKPGTPGGSDAAPSPPGGASAAPSAPGATISTDAGALRPGVVGFAVLWMVAFGFVTGPVVYSWSSYYYTLAAVGAALLVGHLARRIGPAGWLGLSSILLWWNAGGSGVRAFSVDDGRWQWTSHLTSFYFQRAAALTDTLGRQLRAIEPAPAPHTRLFFATLPSWAGFQMGNGAQVRTLYRDSTLQSYFYSEFSESTAAGYPCRFFYWDGQRLGRLYEPGTEVFFQVGSDLLAFGRNAGARHAFRRGLLAGENPIDHYYWLEWSEFWLGRRAAAEDAWSRFGAADDSLNWWIRMRLARMALLERRDTLEARRQLAAAIRSGIGRPEAHAVLGPLLMDRHSKYGLLELQVAISLKPDDWLARRDLVQGLIQRRLDARARSELVGLERVYPGWQQDSVLSQARAELDGREQESRAVIRF